MITVAVYGAGQLASALAERLERRDDVSVLTGAARKTELLDSGAHVVVIATTTRLADVAADVERAVAAGSNVVVSAEEAAFPWNVNPEIADRIDALARDRAVSVIGGGLNPGFLFDAFVLTLLGAHPLPREIRIKRVVDVSRFGATVRARLGLGFTENEFEAGRARGDILGHAGFSQSMRIVADAINVPIDRIDAQFVPLFGDDGRTAGFHQTYSASTDGSVWFIAEFMGHVALASIGVEPVDTVTIVDEFGSSTASIVPGVSSQEGSVSVIANSIDRIIAAPAGWITVADLPPAYPRANRKSAT